jgi:flavorubredoxin
MERNKKYKTNFSNEDLEIQKIVENNNYLVNNTKVTISLIDVNNYKYVSKVKKYFPAILERIDFETRYYESK